MTPRTALLTTKRDDGHSALVLLLGFGEIIDEGNHKAVTPPIASPDRNYDATGTALHGRRPITVLSRPIELWASLGLSARHALPRVRADRFHERS